MESVRLTTAASSPAPALSRGLAVLALLGGSSEALSLEAVAGKLRLPKASVYRFLTTLLDLGLVRKTAEKCYEPLFILQALEDSASRFRHAMAAELPRLAAASGCTAEWYEPGPEGMRLVLQEQPETELRVQARPGFLRPWAPELEAVNRLAHAFCPAAPRAPVGLSLFTANGVRTVLTPAEIQRLIAAAAEARTAWDTPFNSNGVRRYAAAAVRGGRLIGIVALAEAFHFKRRNRSQKLLQLMTQTLKKVPIP